MNYTFSDFCQFVRLSDQHIVSDEKLLSIVFDSRRTPSTGDSLFFALVGSHNDGHLYINEMAAKGVQSFVVKNGFKPDNSLLTTCNFVWVDDTLVALQEFAEHHRALYTKPLVAITGSNGKTIVKEWIVQLVGNDRVTVRSPRSYNSQLGVPISLSLIHKDTQLAVIEAGISFPNEMGKLEKMVKPTIGIITNIGTAHQENFSTVAEKLAEKLTLFKDCSKIIYCSDHPLVHNELVEKYSQKELVSWGEMENSTLQIVDFQELVSSWKVSFRWKENSYQVIIPFSDNSSYENAFHAITALLVLGFEPEIVIERVKHLHSVAMRLEQKEGINGCLVINDSYNADINGLEVALDYLESMGHKAGLTKTVILSDILQSGIDGVHLYKRVAHLLKLKQVTRMVGIGPDMLAHSSCFDKNSHFYASTRDFLASADSLLFRNEAILVKGSRNFAFERISEFLEHKRHRTCLEINLNAMISNLSYYRSYLPKSTKMLAMVKAFSYGSGSFEIANLLANQKIDYLGVAFADEGVELRDAGINLPIVVMGPEEKSFSLMIQYNLEPEIFGFPIFDSFTEAVEREGLSNFPVHIKIDTGMMRLGFRPNEVPQLLKKLKSNKVLKVESIFSHLAGSEASVHDEFTKNQIATFKSICSQIEETIGYSAIKHICNSAGIERFPEAHLDMVRIGIGMYGVTSKSHTKLQNVASLKSSISQVKIVESGETVGYGRRGNFPEGGRIAIIPVGYADGLDRRLGNGVGKVLIHNQFAPIVGSICMDMCMADVTNVDCAEGDAVYLFDENQTISDLADAIGTIPYEILTGISRRVKRVYFMD